MKAFPRKNLQEYVGRLEVLFHENFFYKSRGTRNLYFKNLEHSIFVRSASDFKLGICVNSDTYYQFMKLNLKYLSNFNFFIRRVTNTCDTINVVTSFGSLSHVTE